MKCKAVAFIALALSLISHSLQADSLRDIYELALENDAQLKAQEATYLARREIENLNRAQLLPQVTGSHLRQNTDTETEALQPDFDRLNRETGRIPIIETTRDSDIDNQGYQLSLSQALFDLPAWFDFQSGKQVTKEAEATFAADQQNLIVHEAEAARDLARVNRIVDENNVSVALERLSVLTGQRHSNLQVLAEDFKVKP